MHHRLSDQIVNEGTFIENERAVIGTDYEPLLAEVKTGARTSARNAEDDQMVKIIEKSRAEVHLNMPTSNRIGIQCKYADMFLLS